MSVRQTEDAIIVLEGRCPVGDAEPLQRLLLSTPGGVVDWRACDHLHTALVQVLLIFRPALLGPPRAEFLRKHIEPLVLRT